MNTVKLSSRIPTRREQAKAAFARPAPEVVDWERLKSELNARQFVGPATPISLRHEFSHEAESVRFWNMADNIRRYGRVEQSAHGTPFVGDAFGFQL